MMGRERSSVAGRGFFFTFLMTSPSLNGYGDLRFSSPRSNLRATRVRRFKSASRGGGLRQVGLDFPRGRRADTPKLLHRGEKVLLIAVGAVGHREVVQRPFSFLETHRQGALVASNRRREVSLGVTDIGLVCHPARRPGRPEERNERRGEKTGRRDTQERALWVRTAPARRRDAEEKTRQVSGVSYCPDLDDRQHEAEDEPHKEEPYRLRV